MIKFPHNLQARLLLTQALWKGEPGGPFGPMPHTIDRPILRLQVDIATLFF